MSDERDGPRFDRRQKIALFFVGMLLFSGVVAVAETFTSGSHIYGGGGKFNASDGPKVTLGKDYNLSSGQPATSRSINLSSKSEGWMNVSAQAGEDTSPMEVTVDQINGTWTEVSAVNSPNGNITLQPSDKNFTRIGGGITRFNFTDMKVEDGQVDIKYSANSQATIVVETNATDGTSYGLVDPDTREALDVAIADSGGEIKFTDVEAATDQEAQIEEVGTLFIRNETEPHNKVTGANVEVMFFEDEDDNPTIISRTDSDNDGQIDLSGLPIDEPFVVTVTDADPYFDRQVLLDDLTQQKTIFLLNSSRASVDNRFQIQDRTGNFPPGETEIVIQKAINRSEYGGTPSGFSWTAIAGDELGGDQAVQWDLSSGDRYRIIVENDGGDRRILGSYTAKQDGTVTLEIGTIVEDPEAPGQVGAETTWKNDSGTVTVKFEFNDTSQNTNTLWVEMYERGNKSNVLFSNTSYNGPLGSQTISQTVPSNEEDLEWVVKFTTDRTGEDANGRFVVGPTRTVLKSIPAWVKTIIAIGSIVVVAGLFSQLNGDVGALVVAGLGAIFWFVDFMPPEVSDGVIVLAMLTAGVIFIRERRGGGAGL